MASYEALRKVLDDKLAEYNETNTVRPTPGPCLPSAACQPWLAHICSKAERVDWILLLSVSLAFFTYTNLCQTYTQVMDLVLFQQAMEHVTRIARIMDLPR